MHDLKIRELTPTHVKSNYRPWYADKDQVANAVKYLMGPGAPYDVTLYIALAIAF